MRRIIATVAFGEVDYFHLAVMLFESLHRTGSTAERVCVSDRVYAFPEHLGVTCVVTEASATMKASAPLLLDLQRGDYLMLVDTDILFAQNPDHLFQGERVRVATTGIPLKAFDFNCMYLDEAHAQRMPIDRRCINTGLMVFPAAQAWHFSAVWSSFHAEVRGDAGTGYITLQDQPALEALLVRGVLDAELLPASLMHFPAGTKNPPFPDCVVLHYTGYPRTQGGKGRIAEAMRATLERL